jgi:hypothetical protein
MARMEALAVAIHVIEIYLKLQSDNRIITRWQLV